MSVCGLPELHHCAHAFRQQTHLGARAESIKSVSISATVLSPNP